jgi:nicotinate-nucleotide adenylyltransferase
MPLTRENNRSRSSSEIRARRSEGLSVRYLVPETVREYMEEKGLYLDE